MLAGWLHVDPLGVEREWGLHGQRHDLSIGRHGGAAGRRARGGTESPGPAGRHPVFEHADAVERLRAQRRQHRARVARIQFQRLQGANLLGWSAGYAGRHAADRDHRDRRERLRQYVPRSAHAVAGRPRRQLSGVVVEFGGGVRPATRADGPALQPLAAGDRLQQRHADRRLRTRVPRSPGGYRRRHHSRTVKSRPTTLALPEDPAMTKPDARSLPSRRTFLGVAAAALAPGCVHPGHSGGAVRANVPSGRAEGVPAPDVETLLGQMTLDEKIGQMTQIDKNALHGGREVHDLMVGSVLSGADSLPHPNAADTWAEMYDGYQSQALSTRLGIPMIYGVDAVHGHGGLKGSTIFPHNIALGCTRSPETVEAAARVTAREVAGTGIDWTFAPCIAV